MDTIQQVETRITIMEKAMKVGQFLLAVLVFLGGLIGLYVSNQVRDAQQDTKIENIQLQMNSFKQDVIRDNQDIKTDLRDIKKQNNDILILMKK